MSNVYDPKSSSYVDRSKRHSNGAAKALLEVMDRKKSNLCVSVDVAQKQSFLSIIDTVGPYVCLIKTHVDIIEDFDDQLLAELKALSERHDFLIFEDRKFADIGNTVKLQYAKGVHKIANWAHIVNAHPVPGPSIVEGLASVGLPLGRGLLLLAEMSTKDNLATGEYTTRAVQMARQRPDFVIGFIAQRRMETIGSHDTSHGEDFLILTPGVGLDVQGDGMGQQYRTPKNVITDAGCDVIIVGRGIYGNGDDVDAIRKQAQRYQAEGWKAYLDRLSK
ncbi:Orotidine 5'-phosphate decarboxylase [Sistotremastrum niveocremeum HHB9708]|uniref:Orotidine 5'-phosphate decarboxylase n=1 Tax=Sistotremastrum niveocremeum HHB9708 TaxID=1314777 RepID=A0A164ZEW9_9AGAM|nr:Orotidine 5'-phosphate decarboxylase [Sistotremastrum niveocremeum HHB9708]